jgi:hypothetical protein
MALLIREKLFIGWKELLQNWGVTSIDWIAFASKAIVDEKRVASYIAWPQCNSDTVVAWENNSDVVGVTYSPDLREVTPAIDSSLSIAFRDAQALGAEALSGVLTPAQISYWTM